jgi:hypothetical protein
VLNKEEKNNEKGKESGGYDEPIGALHGSVSSSYDNYVLKDGKFVRFYMKDVFRPGSSYQAVLTVPCWQDLKKQGSEGGDIDLIDPEGPFKTLPSPASP